LEIRWERFRSKKGHENLFSFNPYSVANTLGTYSEREIILDCFMFQSLFCWKYAGNFIFQLIVQRNEESFNPYSVGNTLGTPQGHHSRQCLICFNPYSVGNTLGTSVTIEGDGELDRFQSLFCWKYAGNSN